MSDPSPAHSLQQIGLQMQQFEECPERQLDLGKPLAAVFVLSCRLGMVDRVELMIDFVARNKHLLPAGNNNALDMGAHYAAYHNHDTILQQLWPHLSSHIQAECLFNIVDADWTTTFHKFFDPQLIDPHSKQGQRILGRAAIRHNEEALSLLIPLFPPFDPKQLLENIGEWFDNDPVSDQLLQTLADHQHRQRMREQLQQAADGGVDAPKKKM